MSVLVVVPWRYRHHVEEDRVEEGVEDPATKPDQ
jgi:hypothetical protein